MTDSICTILLIDDTSTDREQYRRYLRSDSSCTYHFLEAASVASGLKLYQSAQAELTATGRIDAILLDYSLPDAYGLSFLEALQAQNDDQAPPVIMVTGSGDQRIATQAMKLGAADYLVKEDLTPDLLQRTLRGVIALARSRQQLHYSHGRLAMIQGQMAQILETMTDAYVTLDRDWCVTYANQTAAQVITHLTGIAPDDILGKTHWDLFPILTGGTLEQRYRQAVTEQVPEHFEQYYEPTGSWFEIHAYPSAMGLGLYFRDITDRKQAEAALQTSESKLRVMFDQAFHLMGLLSRDGVLLEVNQAALDSISALPSAIIGKNFWETPWWYTAELQQQLQAAIAAAARGETIRYEVRFPDASGGWRITDFSLKPVIDENNQVVLLIAEAYDLTYRKQTEEALRQSEEFKRRMLESSQDCIKVLNLNGELLYMNAGGQCLLEIDDITPYMNTAWLGFWDSVEQEQASQALAKAIAGDMGLFYGYCPTRTGKPKWWEVILSPILNGSQQVEKILAVSRDVTDRKQAEQKLRESEERLKAGVQVAGVGLARFDYATHQIQLSPEAALLYGFSPATSTISRAQIHATFHPDERDELEAIIAQVLDPQGTGWFARDHRVVWPNGEVRCLSVRKQVFFAQSPTGMQPDYAILAAIDVTDRKQAEQKLRESEASLRAGVLVAGVGLARFDYATHQVELSPEAATLYGFSTATSTVSRTQIHATFHPDERDELEVIIAQVLDPEGTGWFARDHRVVWPNGEVRCLSVRKQVFFAQSPTGMQPDYAILAAIDVTDRQEIQAELEARNHELDSFVHVVSHDLKAPLRGISNLSQWIEDDIEGSLSFENQERMTLLRSRVNRMSATINGLLDHARLGRTNETIELVSVAELLAETIDSLAPPPTMTIVVSPPLPIFNTNRLLLSQVFANLISNSIKHHDRSDGSIHISGEECGDFYRFIVTDDGPGIAPEHHDQIFAIFQAVNPQTRSDSTGIGLSIVKKIVETGGGTIHVASAIGQGATFCFTWPKS